MTEILNLLIGAIVLILGIPIGNVLAKYTKEELKDGRKWFNLLIFIGLIGGVVGLIIRNDALMFSFLFIAVVTSRSLMRKEKRKSKNDN
ncbi:MAG: hypothetical protein Q8O84_01750 [Nanoarchaeota archaeon]|nr:hypothetical protein [Nanoarchaeota archaeon]MDP3758609.1 hypothetical protein [Candidatus Daviesbacteria bacterium]